MREELVMEERMTVRIRLRKHCQVLVRPESVQEVGKHHSPRKAGFFSFRDGLG